MFDVLRAVGGVVARLFPLLRSAAETLVASWRIGQLAVEHRSVVDAAFHESRPRGNPRPHVDLFRQQPPQTRVVPAQVVTRTVSMGSNACAKTLRLGDQLFFCQAFQIFVQVITFLWRAARDARAAIFGSSFSQDTGGSGLPAKG